jgi:hypothetical protein
VIRYIKRTLYAYVSRFLFRTILVEGVMKGTDYPFRCLFIDESTYTKYLMGRTFEGPCTVLKSSRVWLPLLRKHIAANDHDLCIAVLPVATDPGYHDQSDYRCTHHIQQIVDTSVTWEEIRRAFSKRTRGKVNMFQKKYDFTYRISTSLEDFEHFYHSMHVPHTKTRYGEIADIDSYDEMKKYFLKGKLLFVVRNDVAVAGSLILIEDETLFYRRAGVLDGDESHIKDDAQFALYYFMISYAKENNLKAVDLMWSVSFLNDGVFGHKRRWGATVYPLNNIDSWIHYYNVKPSAKMAKFFEINPLIYYGKKGLEALVGMTGDPEISTDAINKYIRKYKNDGIHRYTVITPQDTIKLK